MLPKSEKGATPFIFLLIVLAVVAFVIITNLFNFKDQLFNTLYPKPPSHAASAVVFLTDTRINTLKNLVSTQTQPNYASYLKLKSDADAQLSRTCHAPTSWYVPAYYTDPTGNTTAQNNLQDDARYSYKMAVAYRITGDERYASEVAYLLNCWATTVQTLDKTSGTDSQLAWSYHFPAMIYAADLIKNSLNFTPTQQQTFADFVRNKSYPENTMSSSNNHGDWGLVLVLATGYYLQDNTIIQSGVDRYKFFIEDQIGSNGEMRYEVHRQAGGDGDGSYGIYYSHFAILPLTLSAEMMRVNVTDLFTYVSPSGHTLQHAFEQLAYWTHYPDKFPYATVSSSNFYDDWQYVLGFEIDNDHWNNVDATYYLGQYRPIDNKYIGQNLTFTHGDLPLFNDTSSSPIPTLTPTTTPSPTSSPISSSSVTLNTNADTSVSALYPTSINGADTTLYVNASPINITYYKFDLSGLAGQTLTSAKLRVKTTSGQYAGSSSTQNVKIVTDTTWSESSMTYNNHPALSSTILGNLSNTSLNTTYDINLAVSSLQPYLGQVLSLGMDTGGTDGLELASKEAGSPAQLILNFGVSSPTPVVTPTPTSIPTPIPNTISSILEAENMSLIANSGALQVFSDPLASNGQGMVYYSNATSNGSINDLANTTKLTVRARGDQCKGAPHMLVSVDGIGVVATHVSSSSWADYSANIPLVSGNHMISITYDNDLARGNCDRNLRVDKVTLL